MLAVNQLAQFPYAIRPISQKYISSFAAYVLRMKLALELEFPDDQAARVLRLLQSVPDVTARILPHPASVGMESELSPAEQSRLLHEVFGSWKSEESGEDMVRRLYADRQDHPREVNL